MYRTWCPPHTCNTLHIQVKLAQHDISSSQRGAALRKACLRQHEVLERPGNILEVVFHIHASGIDRHGLNLLL